MKVLAFDTSSKALSLAILEDKQLLAETTINIFLSVYYYTTEADTWEFSLFLNKYVLPNRQDKHLSIQAKIKYKPDYIGHKKKEK